MRISGILNHIPDLEYGYYSLSRITALILYLAYNLYSKYGDWFILSLWIPIPIPDLDCRSYAKCEF